MSTPLSLPPELLARGRQAAADIRAIEAAMGLPMLTVESRYQAAIEAISALTENHRED
jgi:hypothetical protein